MRPLVFALAALAALAGCSTTTLDPSAAPVTAGEVAQNDQEAQELQSSTAAPPAEAAVPPGETEMTFTEAPPPPPRAAPKPKKGMEVPRTSKRRPAMFATK